MIVLLDYLARLEREEVPFSVDDYSGSGSLLPYICCAGSTNVMFSASHSIAYMSGGVLQQPEKYTGGFAAFMNLEHNCPAIYATRFGCNDYYRDMYSENMFKQDMITYINNHDVRCLIDLHVLTDVGNFIHIIDPCYDSNNCASGLLKEIFKRKFQKQQEGKYIVKLDQLDALKTKNIIRCVSVNTVAMCMELCVSQDFLNPQKMVDCVTFVECIKKFLDIMAIIES